MKRHLSIFTIIYLATLFSCYTTEKQLDKSTEMQYPIAQKKVKELTIHEHKRTDNYYWLNQKTNPDVIKYLEDENKYSKKMLSHTENLQEKIFKEITERIKQDDESVPYLSNGYYYYFKNEDGKEYDINCRKKGSLEAKEEIYLDENELAKGTDYFSAVGFRVSPNNKILAIGVDVISRREYDIKFKDLETGEFLEDIIPKTTGGTVWANDNKTVFYTKKDEVTLRSYKIFKHVLGTPISEDVLVYQEKDEMFDCYVWKSKSSKFIIIETASTLSSEAMYLDANKPNSDFKIVHSREENIEYSVLNYENEFYIVTNWEAENFRLMKCKINNPAKENWVEVIPHREDVLLESVELFKNHLVVEERKEGLMNIRIMNTKDNSEHYLNFGEEAYLAYVQTNKEFDTEIMRFAYGSMTTPSSVFDYNMNTKEKTLLKEQDVLGGFDKKNYKTKRVYATARDGAKVPISIVYRKDTPLDGTAPLLLYGYGSYGASMDAYFSYPRLSLLDRGFVFAIAHIRGGQEMGRKWYENGKFLKKQNTFNDFIDCGKHLIENKFGSTDKLCIMGGSAGGLLMGAVINQEPEMFRAVVAAVPFVDVVTTMLDESIPLTTGEYEEWGNPNEKEYYEYMLSYSPYDNVEAKEYPAMLVTTGLHDSQVQYWEPAKWVAKLRDVKTDDNLLILHTNMEAGHGGASGRFEQYKESAMEYAFFFDQLGITE